MTTSPGSANAEAMPANRRSFIASLAAAGALGLPALPALAAPDAELLALRGPFDRTWADYLAALDVHSAAEAAAFGRRRREPGTPRETVDAEEGLTAANALVHEAETANHAIVEAMCWIPAQTLAGLAFKAKVSLEHEDNLYPELVTSIMDDILAMGGAHA